MRVMSIFVLYMKQMTAVYVPLHALHVYAYFYGPATDLSCMLAVST